MRNNLYVQVVFDLPVEGPFDYAVPPHLRDKISVGCRVSVMFRNRRQIGFVTGLMECSDIANVLPVLSAPDDGPVFDPLHLQWMRWLSGHYGCTSGQALAMSIPMSLRRSSRIHVPVRPQGECRARRTTHDAPRTSRFALIHDPSQKHQWPLIEERIREVWMQGLGVLILVPEISYFRKWREILRPYRAFSFIVDPALKDKERTAQWMSVRQAPQALVFGTRSAVFAPVRNLGLILMAEEDHDFFKEEQSPFHHVRDVVLKKAELTGCAAVFVSRVPGPELWELSEREHWPVQTCPVDRRGWFQKIDVANFTQMQTVSLAPPLVKRIEEALAAKTKTLLYWNRRGYHHVTSCLKCGENIRCPRCDVNLVYSMERKMLFCGRCGFAEVSGNACPKCHSPLLKSFGRGGEKLAKDLKKFFPSATIARHDSDEGELPDADITIATQSVLNRDVVRPYGLIAVLDFDSELARPDFRAGHKAFGLLVRLRCLAENMVVQTRNASDPVLLAVGTLDFPAFYRYDLSTRRELKLPPFGHLLDVVVRGLDAKSVEAGAQALYDMFQARGLNVSDPRPDSRPKWRDKYRWRLILKDSDAERMVSGVKEALRGFRKSGLTVTINLDP